MRTRLHSIGIAAIVAGGLLAQGCEGVLDTRVEYDTFNDSRTIGDYDRLSVMLDFGVGNLDLGADLEPGELYSLELEYDRLHFEPELDFGESEGEATLRFELDSTGFPLGDNDNDLVVRLSPELPIALSLEAGVGQSYIDLTDLQIERLTLDGGVGRTEVTFDSVQEAGMSVIDIDSGVGEVVVRGLGNARVRDFRFDGGVGSAEIDFTGDWGDGETRADIDVGVGEVHILIPAELRVEILTDDNFLSSLSAPDFEQRQGRYTRNMENGGRPQAEIRIDAGLGEIRLEVR